MLHVAARNMDTVGYRAQQLPISYISLHQQAGGSVTADDFDEGVSTCPHCNELFLAHILR